ncbi:MAG: HAD-IC family P-type ATPase [Flavobacteriales bacterium]|nr:HAD-IC family P-type ATPase [Flavobacteriales bacterium]
MDDRTYHQLSPEETLNRFKTSEEGLTEAEATLRRTQHGLNLIPEAGRRHWFVLLLKQFQSLLILILAIAAFISWLTDHTVDMWVILVIILINALIGFVQEFRAEKAVEALRDMLAPTAKVRRAGRLRTVPASELVPGDIIVLEEGDQIPADARLLDGKDLRCIEAALTGESVPVSKRSDALPKETGMADRRNMLWKSTHVAGGSAVAVVTATGLSTQIGRIAGSLTAIKEVKTHFRQKTDKLAKQMAVVASLSASALFALGYAFHSMEVDELLLVSIAALVSAIPEGLPAVLTIVLAVGAHRMAQRKAIVREFTATETLGAVSVILTDKTGTLTQNVLSVERVALPDGPVRRVTGSGWSPIGNVLEGEEVLEDEQLADMEPLLRVAALCNNAQVQHDPKADQYTLVGDPTEGALLVLARKADGSDRHEGWQRVDDLPFNSDLKLRATLVQRDGKRQLLVVGAPEKVLALCDGSWNGREAVPMDAAMRSRVQQRIEDWSSQAYRVIALAYREVDDMTIDKERITGLTMAGITGMIDPPREDVPAAVQACHGAGIRVIMATGDHINTAVAIGRAIGIVRPDVKPGTTLALNEQQLEKLDEAEFDRAVREVNVFARLTPAMKLRIAERLQHMGELVAMTGDGVNDAPALKKADVGIAMGINGTDVARGSAQVVLADDNFTSIVHAVEEGRIVFTNARQTSFYLLTTNFAEITTLLSTVAMGLPIPLTATQILWLNMVTDGLCDKALAVEQGHGDVLGQQPLKRGENILTGEVVPFVLMTAVLMAVMAIVAFKFFLPQGVEKARTAAFVVMAFSQLYNAYNLRSLKRSIFRIGVFSNKWFNRAIVASVLIQVAIIEIPFLQDLFHFKTLAFLEFLVLALAGSLILVAGEVFKYMRQNLQNR